MSVDEILRNLDVTLTYEIGAVDIRRQISNVRESLEKEEDRTQIITELELITGEVDMLKVVSKASVKRVLEDCLNKIKGSVQPTEQESEDAKNPVLLDLLKQMKVLI